MKESYKEGLSSEERLKGSLEPGKLADLVVLGDDPPTVDSITLIDNKILRTIIGGRSLFEA